MRRMRISIFKSGGTKSEVRREPQSGSPKGLSPEGAAERQYEGTESGGAYNNKGVGTIVPTFLLDENKEMIFV